jgi:hypothetical protein
MNDHITEETEQGNNVYDMLRQEVSDQENMEMAISDKINTLANKSNLLLRAKL